MTAEPLPVEAPDPDDEQPPPSASTVERISTGDPDDRPVIAFMLDDDDTVLHARKPKQYLLLQFMRSEFLPDEEYYRLLDDWLDQVLGDDAEYVRGRLTDPDDSFDVGNLNRLRSELLGKWLGTPTGGRSGSSDSPTTTQKRSTVKRPGRASTSGSSPSPGS